MQFNLWGTKQNFSKLLEEHKEIGFVRELNMPLIFVEGLPGVNPEEMVVFEDGSVGRVLSVNAEYVEVLALSSKNLPIDTKVSRTTTPLSLPVSDNYLGKSINALGHSQYAHDPINSEGLEFVELFTKPPGISKRKSIKKPLITGVSVVDLLVPLGMGQRELIIGDRQTGKSQFALQVMLSQALAGSVCIYANIGKKSQHTKNIEQFIEKNNIASNCIILSSNSADPIGLIFITPYYAMALAEYFMNKGHDVLIIFDDLTTHAKFYREISLIGERFPGRNSYPGDIFHAHAELLERSGNFIHNDEERSISCLSIADTLEGDISGYIQTNLMSITDGHLFFDKEIFTKGRRPSVDYFTSVTRVGRQTQTPLRWDVSRELFSFLTLYEKSEEFVHFGAELNEGIKSTLKMGEKVLENFNQRMGRIVPLNFQIYIFTLIWSQQLKIENISDLVIESEKIFNRYNRDEQYKKSVDELINSSNTLNELLSKVIQFIHSSSDTESNNVQA